MKTRMPLFLACAAGLFGSTNSAAQVTAAPWELVTQQAVVGGSSGVTEISRCNNASGVASGSSCSGYVDIGTSTILSDSLSGTLTTSSGNANLATGEVKIGATGPTYSDARSGAGLRDSIALSIPGLDAGETATIGIRFTIDGSFADGAQLSGHFSAISAFDSLIGTPIWRGTFLGGNTESMSSTIYSIDAAPGYQWNSASGDWSQTGASVFEGQVDIWGSDPLLNINMWLTGSNNFDLLSTATIDLILPTGSSFTSDSGVFLSARGGGGGGGTVPTPGSLPLVIAAVSVATPLLVRMRSRKIASHVYS